MTALPGPVCGMTWGWTGVRGTWTTPAAAASLDAMADQSLAAPEGIVYVDPETLHTWKVVRIGRIQRNAQFQIVWSSDKPVRPVPFPVYRSHEDWLQFLDGLYQGWGGKWAGSPSAGAQ